MTLTLYTYAQAADILGISVRKLKDMVHHKQIRCVKQHRCCVRFRPEDLELWIRSCVQTTRRRAFEREES